VSHFSFSDLVDFGERGDYDRLDLASPRVQGDSIVLPSGLLASLAERAYSEIAFRMPSSEIELFASILDDAAASEADRFVAATLIRNAAVAAEGLYPICQDTGTAVAYGWRGEKIRVEGESDEAAIAEGARRAYEAKRLRKSQLGARDFLGESNTKDNLPALVDLRVAGGSEYRICFAAKGGGSANRTSFTMESPSLLREADLEAEVEKRIRALGASGCPPYRLGLILGGSGPDQTLYALALATLGLLDRVGLAGSAGSGGAAGEANGAPIRDLSWERRMLRIAERTGVGAQFGGSRLAADARALRLPRHAASLPLAMGVSCAAHRRARAVVAADGVFLERLEADPARFLPRGLPTLGGARRIDLDKDQAELASELGSLGAGAFVLLSGTVVVARDAAHARFRDLIAAGKELPGYLLRHPVFYAGPTEAAPGRASGSFGPTTAGRMDAFLEPLMERGASLVTIAKGARSASAAASIARRGGAYLGCIGGAAAIAARDHVASSEIIDYPDLGMEAVRKVVLRDLPAILLIDSRGRDFYRGLAEDRPRPDAAR